MTARDRFAELWEAHLAQLKAELAGMAEAKAAEIAERKPGLLRDGAKALEEFAAEIRSYRPASGVPERLASTPGQRLRAVREAKGMSRREVCEADGWIRAGTLELLEKDRAAMNWAVRARLSKALGLSPAEALEVWGDE